VNTKIVCVGLILTGLAAAGCSDGAGGEPERADGKSALIGPYTIDSSCQDPDRAMIQRAMRLGRIASASNGFATCLRNLAKGTPNAAAPYYPKCNPADLQVNLGISAQVTSLLRLTRSANPLNMRCDPTLPANAWGFIGDFGTTQEDLTWANWITGKGSQIGVNPDDPYWPMSQTAGIIWHEVMHNYGYDHPETCSDPTYGPLYNYQSNTIPYIVQGCMSVMVSAAGNVCQNVSCPANSAAMVTELGKTTCECIKDPGAPNVDLIPCAQENGSCTVGQGGKYMAFGVEGQLVYKHFPPGKMTCDRAAFDNQDPAIYKTKTCYFANYSRLADDNQTFNAYNLTGVTGPINVAYGANGKFLFAKLDGLTSYTCNKALFPGDDLAPNVPKSCYLALAGYHFVSNERYDNTAVLTGLKNTPVAFGANGYFKFAIKSGNVACNTQTFGDPISGISKACYIMDLGKSYLTSEGNKFTMVRGDYCPVGYTSGRNGNISLVSGCSGTCDNASFGDPDSGYTKYCWGMSLIH